MTFKKVGEELPEQWKPEKDGDSIEGRYFQKKENVGKNKANLYIIEVKSELKAIWGCKVLDDKMIYVNIGDILRITYKGLEKGKKQDYHKYDVEKDFDEGEIPDPVDDAVEEAESEKTEE